MLQNKNPIRVLIFGSCVSRDILNFDETAQFKLIDYYARSSLASLGTKPLDINDYNLSSITSPFQRRMVARDMQKSFYSEALPAKNFDVILIDLIDERFDLFEIAPDSFVTVSGELIKSGLVTTAQNNSENWVVSGSDKHRKIWLAGVEYLFSELEALGLTDLVVINKVYWSDSVEDGSPLPSPFTVTAIEQANTNLKWMYEQLERYIKPNKWMNFANYLLKANPQHQWGISPFHYIETYYRSAVDLLVSLAAIINSEKTSNIAEYKIKEVLLINDHDLLIASIVTDDAVGEQFAFYVFRNEERIHTQWYSANAIMHFDTKGESGIYRVFAFLLCPDGNKVTKYSKPVFLNPSVFTLSSVKKPENFDRALKLNGLHWSFSALYFSSDQPRLFIMTSGAVERTKVTLPYFNRWTWAGAGKFPGHVLCIADPTLELHEDMKLGWYLGTSKHNATEELCNIIRHFAEILGVPDSKIIFWGSSGGGFAALALASRIEGSTAVAINAQTNALEYHVESDVEMVRKFCFDGKSGDFIRQGFGQNVNMVKAWKTNKMSRAIFVQNKLDTHHYTCHYQPLWHMLGGKSEGGWTSDGRHFAWLYEDKSGHGPESEQMVPEILRLVDDKTGMILPEMHATGQS